MCLLQIDRGRTRFALARSACVPAIEPGLWLLGLRFFTARLTSNPSRCRLHARQRQVGKFTSCRWHGQWVGFWGADSPTAWRRRMRTRLRCCRRPELYRSANALQSLTPSYGRSRSLVRKASALAEMPDSLRPSRNPWAGTPISFRRRRLQFLTRPTGSTEQMHYHWIAS